VDNQQKEITVKNRVEKKNYRIDEVNYWEGRLDAIKDLKEHLVQKHSALIKEIDDLILVTSTEHIKRLNESEEE
jgi:hypothetical protein